MTLHDSSRALKEERKEKRILDRRERETTKDMYGQRVSDFETAMVTEESEFCSSHLNGKQNFNIIYIPRGSQ